MLAKIGFSAAALVAVVATAHSLDLRKTYNEMYPADGLRRGVFTLCHQTDPMFVRAVQADRESCFERMPHDIALVIGWSHRGTGLAAPAPYDGTLEAAELLFRQAARRQGRFDGPVFALAAPCRTPEPEAAQRTVVAALARDAAATGNTKQPLIARPPAALAPDRNLPVLALTGGKIGEPPPLRTAARPGAASGAAAPSPASSVDANPDPSAAIALSVVPNDRCASGA